MMLLVLKCSCLLSETKLLMTVKVIISTVSSIPPVSLSLMVFNTHLTSFVFAPVGYLCVCVLGQVVLVSLCKGLFFYSAQNPSVELYLFRMSDCENVFVFVLFFVLVMFEGEREGKLDLFLSHLRGQRRSDVLHL